jgi:hypothetical protein
MAYSTHGSAQIDECASDPATRIGHPGCHVAPPADVIRLDVQTTGRRRPEALVAYREQT